MECEWCKSEMEEGAFSCASCGKDRKDFYRHKIHMYTFQAFSMILFIYGIASGAWTNIFGLFRSELIFQTPSGWLLILLTLLSIRSYYKGSRLIKMWLWY